MCPRLLCWPGKERLRSHFNRLFLLGVKEVGDIVEAQSQRILGFVEARQLLGIPPNYGFIWQYIQNIQLMQGPLPLQTEEYGGVIGEYTNPIMGAGRPYTILGILNCHL